MADGARRRRCCVDLFAKVKHEIFFTPTPPSPKIEIGTRFTLLRFYSTLLSQTQHKRIPRKRGRKAYRKGKEFRERRRGGF